MVLFVGEKQFVSILGVALLQLLLLLTASRLLLYVVCLLKSAPSSGGVQQLDGIYLWLFTIFYISICWHLPHMEVMLNSYLYSKRWIDRILRTVVSWMADIGYYFCWT